jgi:electron transport complex protein RnfE
MGLGFTFALVLLGGVRELLGQGELFGFDVFGASYPDVLLFILPPGAFIALGFILAGVNIVNNKLQARKDGALAHAASETTNAPESEAQTS